MRVWEVSFQVYNRMPSLPVPGELVEELQFLPSYGHDGATRRRHGANGGQLAVTLEGEGGFRLDGKNHALPPGRAFLANHADPRHAYFYPSHGKAPWRFLWISFSGAAAEAMVEDFNARFGYLYDLPLLEGLAKRLGAYRHQGRAPLVLSPMDGAAMVVNVFRSLEAAVGYGGGTESNDLLVREAQAHILRNLGENIGVNGIAGALRISREHLSRCFKERTGQSPREFMMDRRMDVARRLLRETMLDCGEVAGRLGFSGSASFSRAFKRANGVCPRGYRDSIHGRPA